MNKPVATNDRFERMEAEWRSEIQDLISIKKRKVWREYAAAALQGLLAEPHPPGDADSSIRSMTETGAPDGEQYAERLARAAANAADALLVETEKRGQL